MSLKNSTKIWNTSFVGDLSKFSSEMQNTFKEARRKTKNNTGVNVYFAFKLRRKTEIFKSCEEIVKENPKSENITSEYFEKYLETYPKPDPDIIIRTSENNDFRAFFPWQSVYSELFFTKNSLARL